ncbi:MAG: glycosyltransferase family 2 protein [Brevundimonas sp.]|uniref:glycosyltransferase family 2 protein n=1 Tax=Brevundimonas sp. TaxID=1871086 RepID=UPI0039193BED
MTTGPIPSVSVIVSTRNRGGKLEQCLRSIERASSRAGERPVELVVVDNGSTDATPDLLRRLQLGPGVRLITLSEPRPGLSCGRNLGLAHASGDLLVFTDDDCEMHPQYLTDLQRYWRRDERDIIRGGRVELGVATDQPVSIKLSPDRERLGLTSAPGGFVLGCNMTMSRAVADRVGRFDERFGAGARFMAAEDTDYQLRAIKAGIEVEYVPDMTIIHHHGRASRQDALAVNRGYNIGNGALYLKHAQSAPWLLRHFFWTLKGGVKEWFGGPLFDPYVRVSHWPIVAMNLVGAWRYVRLALRAEGGSASSPRGARVGAGDLRSAG